MYMYEIVDKMNALIDESKKMMRILLGGFLGGMSAIFLITFYLISVGNPDSPVIGYLALTLIIVIMVLGFLFGPKMNKNKKEVRALYKEHFMQGVFEEFFEEAHYQWDKGLTKEEILQSGLLLKGTSTAEGSVHSEDYLSGIYKGIPFIHVDVFYEYKTSNSGTAYYTKGRLLQFDYPFKKVQSVMVIPKWGEMLGIVSKALVQYSQMDSVKLENMKFNKAFAASANNPEEVFYVLTPQVMERILEIWNKYGGLQSSEHNNTTRTDIYRSILFHFKQDKLYVWLDNMDSFEHATEGTIEYPKEKARIKKDIQVIIDVIEMLIGFDNM